MKAVGFSLNNLSLFGLVLAIGIVVDDAIVVVENVERWIHEGLSPREATYKAMEEVTGRAQDVEFGFDRDGGLVVFQTRRILPRRME